MNNIINLATYKKPMTREQVEEREEHHEIAIRINKRYDSIVEAHNNMISSLYEKTILARVNIYTNWLEQVSKITDRPHELAGVYSKLRGGLGKTIPANMVIELCDVVYGRGQYIARYLPKIRGFECTPVGPSERPSISIIRAGRTTKINIIKKDISND